MLYMIFLKKELKLARLLSFKCSHLPKKISCFSQLKTTELEQLNSQWTSKVNITFSEIILEEKAW